MMRKRNRAKIRCVTYGGRIGWYLRKHFSRYTSAVYLKFEMIVRNRLFRKYISYFNNAEKKGLLIMPCLISIETINRCNSTCSFCPANRNQDKRPFAKMDQELFEKIICELEDIQYDGYLNLYVNNEPFMDNRIEEWYKYAKTHLPNAHMLLYTNGTLLTLERFLKISPYIDKMIINNYSTELKVHDNITKIIRFIRENEEFWEKDITVQIRYIDEILTNRAGSAPNKAVHKKTDAVCIMPFTDFTIFPNGTVGLCCNDALEQTNLGNVRKEKLIDLWRTKRYSQIRKIVGQNREGYPFCQGCDFIDAGIRNAFIKTKLKESRHNIAFGRRE